MEEAFYLGDALLIYPILREGERSHTLSLPKGHWYNFWNDNFLEGGKTIQLEAPLEQIPVLVRAGSILPMEDTKQLTLHLYPPLEGETESCIYSDAGDGYEDSRRDRFCLIRDEQNLELIWQQ